MQLLSSDTTPSHGLIATVGFFDGLHLGHRWLMQQLQTMALQRALSSVVVTFTRHPREVLPSSYTPRMLSTAAEKMEKIAACGIDYTLLLDFTPALAALSAREFIRMLHTRYGVVVLLMGYDHRFGSDRHLSYADYIAVGAEEEVEVIVCDEFLYRGKHVSSTTLRTLIEAGDMSDVYALLNNRYYTLQGEVIAGKQLGRTIGFPTANLRVCQRKVIPAQGVYAVWCDVDGLRYGGMLNIGYRPTVDRTVRESIEVHLFGFDGDLYGRTLTVSFVDFVRPEMRKNSIDELQKQLVDDQKRVEAILSRSL